MSAGGELEKLKRLFEDEKSRADMGWNQAKAAIDAGVHWQNKYNELQERVKELEHVCEAHVRLIGDAQKQKESLEEKINNIEKLIRECGPELNAASNLVNTIDEDDQNCYCDDFEDVFYYPFKNFVKAIKEVLQ